MKLKWETELEFLKRKVDEYEKKIIGGSYGVRIGRHVVHRM